jgi:hypothetical protein
MWKPDHRRAADRRGLRYDSDLTAAEWALVEPLIRPAKRGGRPRTVNVREVLNAVCLSALDRLSVEGSPKGSAAAQHGLGVSRLVGMGRHPQPYSSCSVRRDAGAGGPGGEPNHRHHR